MTYVERSFFTVDSAFQRFELVLDILAHFSWPIEHDRVNLVRPVSELVRVDLLEASPVSSKGLEDILLSLVLLPTGEPIPPSVAFVLQLLDDFVSVVEFPVDVREVDNEEVSWCEFSLQHELQGKVLSEVEDETEWNSWLVFLTSLVVEWVEAREHDLI